MKARWTGLALRRLRQLHDHIALDQPLNAQRFVDRLTRHASEAAHRPEIGRVVPEFQRDDVREVFEGAYRLIYRVTDDGIDVLTVRHGARLMPARLQDL